VLAGYQSVRTLREGWRDRVGLHQLYPLLAHVVLFGSGYGRQTEAAAASALTVAS
jgi:fructosamine-3-kinase